MNALLKTALIAIAALLCTSALQAHGSAKPQHGGIAIMSGETVFELVVTGDKAEVYVVDDGDDIDSSAFTGQLTVNLAGKVADSVLKPAGGNKFEATGVSIAKGASVIVKIRQADQKQQFAMFVIK
jgi:glycerol-3-phosphate dehydrogenase